MHFSSCSEKKNHVKYFEISIIIHIGLNYITGFMSDAAIHLFYLLYFFVLLFLRKMFLA